MRSGAIDCIVIDSVAAMVTKAEIDGEMGDTHVGLLARLMSQAMRKLTAVISKSNCVAIFINQVREKIGVIYGNPETTTGGRALKFYSSVRIEVRRSEAIKSNGEVIGARTKCKVVKNKVSPPFKECEFDLYFGKGISRTGEVVDLAVNFNIIQKSGAWFSYNGAKIGQGRDNAKEYLQNNPEIMKEIEEKIKVKYDEQIEENKKNSRAKAAAAAVQKDSAAKEADEVMAAAAETFEPRPKMNVEIDAEDDFEEFTPVK